MHSSSPSTSLPSLHLASLGANLVLNYAANSAQADPLASQINSTPTPNRAVAVKADVSNPEAVKSLFDRAKEEFGIHPWGWRLSLGLAGVPATILFLGSLVITETPTSLVEQGRSEEGLAMLRRIRGTHNVELEYDEIVRACALAQRVERPFRELMERSSQPPLVITVLLQVFQQFTGINAIMFYAPILFQTIGFGSLVHIVVNNAGVSDPKYPTIASTTLEDFDRIFYINVRGNFLVCREAANRIARGSGGRIVTLLTSLVAMSTPGYGAYTASKEAVELKEKMRAFWSKKKDYVCLNGQRTILII